MAVKLSKTQLPELKSWLEEHLPYSFKIHAELKYYLRGQLSEMDLYVDRWPHPQAAIALRHRIGQQCTSDREVIGSVFGLKSEAVADLLQDPRVVSWDHGVFLDLVPVHMKTGLVKKLREMGKFVTPLYPGILLKATLRDLKTIPVPEGMKPQAISNTEIKIIHSTWRYSAVRPESYIRGLAQHFPYVYLVTDHGLHVGHMLGKSEGTLGMLYVNPDFRGKGYGKVIVSQLAQKYFDQGDDAYVFVEEDNVSSQNLHFSLGFKPVSEYLSLQCD